MKFNIEYDFFELQPINYRQRQLTSWAYNKNNSNIYEENYKILNLTYSVFPPICIRLEIYLFIQIIQRKACKTKCFSFIKQTSDSNKQNGKCVWNCGKVGNIWNSWKSQNAGKRNPSYQITSSTKNLRNCVNPNIYNCSSYFAERVRTGKTGKNTKNKRNMV